MTKTVAIVQPNYIPWKGYFDLIRQADEFILFDDVQYTRRDWRNRNRIKTPRGISWLTIPVEVKGKYTQTIRETKIADPNWAATHWQTLSQNYSRAPFFAKFREPFQSLYHDPHGLYLSDINEAFLRAICEVLGIQTTITRSTDYNASGDTPTERLVQLCRRAGGTEYLSGPSAQAYLEENRFHEAGLNLRYIDYSAYPVYPQLHGSFDHSVTVLDLLFMTGPDALTYLQRMAHAA